MKVVIECTVNNLPFLGSLVAFERVQFALQLSIRYSFFIP